MVEPRVLPTLAMSRTRHLVGSAVMGAVLWLCTRALAPAPLPTELVVHVAAGADVEPAIDEAVLLEAALARDLPWSDPFVRARLLEDLRARDPDTEAQDDEALLQRAKRIGLARAHPVVRARIVDAMSRWLVAHTSIEAPDDAALTAYRDAHVERYMRPERIDLVQVQLAAESRPEDVAAMTAMLQRTRPEDALALGEASVLPRALSGVTSARVDATFGPAVASAAFVAEPREWTGPVRGSYGLHWLFVRTRDAGGVPALAEIRDRVLRDWEHDAREAGRREAITRLRAGHRITVVREGDAP
jgi:hypothetical protein